MIMQVTDCAWSTFAVRTRRPFGRVRRSKTDTAAMLSAAPRAAAAGGGVRVRRHVRFGRGAAAAPRGKLAAGGGDRDAEDDRAPAGVAEARRHGPAASPARAPHRVRDELP